jgi:hypothetical protein
MGGKLPPPAAAAGTVNRTLIASVGPSTDIFIENSFLLRTTCIRRAVPGSSLSAQDALSNNGER